MATLRIPGIAAIVTYSPGFKAGDPAPSGYLDWHEWAEVQHKAGLRQVQCPNCGRWKYPQELSTLERRWPEMVAVKRGRVVERRLRSAFICLACVSCRDDTVTQCASP